MGTRWPTVHLNTVRPRNGKTSNSTSLVPTSSMHSFVHPSTYLSIDVPIHLVILPTHPSTQHLRSILHSCARERVSLALLGLGFYERSPTTQWKTATGCDGSRNRSHGNAKPGVHPPQAEKQEIEGDRGTICCLVQTFVTELPFSKAGNAVSTVHS